MSDSKVHLLTGNQIYREDIASFLTAHDIPVVSLSTLQLRELNGVRGCLIVDNELGGETGCFDIIRQQSRSTCPLPTILICVNPDTRLAISAFRAGVVDFIILPIELKLVLAAVQKAFREDRRIAERRAAQKRFTSITDDEHQVISLMLNGATNRRIASLLHIGVRTVERLRSRILTKIGAESPLEVARLHTLAFHDEQPLSARVHSDHPPSNNRSIGYEDRVTR